MSRATAAPRLVAIWKTVTHAVTATHNHAFSRACRQLVSSRCATCCSRTCSRACSTAAASAWLTWASSLLMLPSATSTPNTSPRSCCTSRLDSRYWPANSATSAISRGPKAPLGTPSGNCAWVKHSHFSHHPECCWYSVTWGFTGGISTTWCLHAAGACSFFTSAPSQRLHASGCSATVLSTFCGGSNSRLFPLCPFCPPGFLPVGAFASLFTSGPSLEGGLLQLREVRPNCSSNSAIRASAAFSCSSSSAIRASLGSTSAMSLLHHVRRHPVQHHFSGHLAPAHPSTKPDV